MFSFLRNWRKAKGLSEMLLRRLLWNGSIMIYPHWSCPMPDSDLEITGVGVSWSPKEFFGPFRPQFGPEIGEVALPWIHH